MRDTNPGTAKIIQSLESKVELGDYYEAQQTYKTRYARYVAGKKFDDALQLLQSGACVQLKHGQVTCGAELGVLLIETFRKANVVCGSEALDKIKAVYDEFPRVDTRHIKVTSENGGVSEDFVAARTRVEGCTAFLKAAIKWAMDSGANSIVSELHHMLAEYIWTQSPVPELGKASLHYLRGNCPADFAQALVEYIGKCYPEETDLVVARAVLQYLAMGNLSDANSLWGKLKELSAEGFPDTPLLHFIKFLLLTLERDALPLLNMLRQKYKPSIDRDPSFDEYLDNVAELFYNVRPKNGIQGMLGDIMKMFSDV